MFSKNPCKGKERGDLARRIKLTSIEMIPCWYCEHYNRKCVVSRGSTRCSKYILGSWKYNIETIIPTN